MADSSPDPPSTGVPPLRLVFLESTAECNLACAHCRRVDVGREMSRWSLSTHDVSELIDDLGRSHGRTLFIFSGGEPLLRADLFPLAERARRCGLRTALATNGTRVTPEVAERIAGAGFSRVSISLDGPRADTHDALRGVPGSFDKALAGLRHVRDAGQSVQINTSITRANAGELEAMFRLAESERVAALHVFVVVPVGCGAELSDEDRLSPSEYEQFLRQFVALSREANVETRATCAPQYARITRHVAGPDMAIGGHGGAPGRACLAGLGVCFVSHTGDVFPCGYLPVRCGNIREMPLSEIWRTSEVFARLRQPNLLGGKCGLCDHRSICGGCRARAFAATGDYMAAEPDCLYQGPQTNSQE